MSSSTGDLGVVDITSVSRYDRSGYPWADWDLLRAVAPVHRYERAGFPPFWAVTRYDDVRSVHSRPGEFRNGGPFLRLRTSADLDTQAAYQRRRAARRGWDPEEPIDMVFLDQARHFDLRMLTMRRFTPNAMRRLEDELADLARRAVGAFVDTVHRAAPEPVDLVAELARGVPLAAICGLLGVPESDWRNLVGWTDELFFPIAPDSPTLRPGESQRDARSRLGLEYHAWREELIADRRARGDVGDDMATLLVHATIDGAPLTDQRLHGYLELLVAAGNETTRNAIAGGVTAFIEHHDEAARFAADPDALVESAVEEVLRWTSPVIQFARQATCDTSVGGVEIAAGEMVVLWYPSANRDERQFPDPYRFDVARTPNQHLAFGHGPHFCLGANLARWELRAVFRELAVHLPSLELAGAAQVTTDLHVGTVHHLPVRWRTTV
jgi:cytochrome P450